MAEPRRKSRQNHVALARQIVAIAQERNLRPGDHLPEQVFSEACGVSRTPVRSAFKILEENKFLKWRPEEGYFLATEVTRVAPAALQRLGDVENSLAERILTDRTERRIADVQSVSALVRRYEASRNSVLNALKVLSQDGIVTQLPGRAWAFQPMIDSPRAIAESFEFRLLAEPQAILAPGFRLDLKRAGALRSQMEAHLAESGERRTAAEFQRIDVAFHGLIAECSGNRFLRGGLMAHHRLREASRKRVSIPDFRLKQAMEEHLDILDSLERNLFDLAADQMTVHLRRSQIRKPEAANRGIPPLMRGARA